jgi:hypothetical protein
MLQSYRCKGGVVYLLLPKCVGPKFILIVGCLCRKLIRLSAEVKQIFTQQSFVKGKVSGVYK